MGVALLSAKRSKDPSTQVGACIVNDKHKIVGAGYNGLPAGCDDDEFPWARQGEFLDTKYPYICHAELNAILNNIGMDLKGCKIYTALFPCNECTKAIIQSGIREVSNRCTSGCCTPVREQWRGARNLLPMRRCSPSKRSTRTGASSADRSN